MSKENREGFGKRIIEEAKREEKKIVSEISNIYKEFVEDIRNFSPITKTLILTIIILFLAFVVFFFISRNQLEQISEEDFQIINSSWNDYGSKYSSNKKEWILDEAVSLYWDYYCSGGCVKITSDEQCRLKNYQITTYSSEELTCNFQYDNEKGAFVGDSVNIKPGISTSFFGEYGLDLRQSHKIIMCCGSKTKAGTICDEITLESKCELI